MTNSAGAFSSDAEEASFREASSGTPVPNGVRTSVPSDALMYEPSSPPQRVLFRQPGDDVFMTLTGLAQTGSDDAKGPDAGTLPENPHGAGTERFRVAVYPIGPSWQRLDQAAVFVGVGSGLMSTDSRQAPIGGHEMKTVAPLWMDGRLGIYIELNIVAMGTIPSIQFQITCTGVVDTLDPDPQDPSSSVTQTPNEPSDGSRYGSSEQRFESDDDRYDPFERGDRNRPFDDRDFDR